MNNQKPSRGEIWFVNLNPTVGHEQAKTRPCLVISNDAFNHGYAHLHVILPLTSKNKNNPLHVRIPQGEAELEKESFVLCDQMRTVSRQRFKGRSFGSISDETLEVIEDRVRILLNL